MIQLLLAIIYLAFISLGLPDSLLGSAWPSMYGSFGVPVSYAGIISMIIAAGTIVSSLQSDRLTRKLGAGKVTAISVGMTAFALFGFSVSSAFWMLCLWAIPYGLGAGSVDAALNNFVALHFKSRHMSWLHCMWGVGASVGPYIMSFALTNGQGWNMGYRYIAILQVVLTAILVFSLPLWKMKTDSPESQPASAAGGKALSLREVIRIPGAKEVMLTFFCYCAIEQTTGLWGSSYLVLHEGVTETEASSLASLFYIGITAGRAVGGFLTMALNDTKMVRLGEVLILSGIIMILLPLPSLSVEIGLILVGLGCAPIYPSIIHATPSRFGADRSQAVIGIQMASAYVGTCLMPPLFGWIAQHVGISLFPLYLLLLLLLMFFMHEKTILKTRKEG
ncbi:MAG: MFS transporter [Lachnospiraceae bacterium]|jgi:fucose permease|nr:MFS transporter [Lachnospiraceae bacterium]